jgi:2-polyprenyl-3-methyl-5-hydroxy-6-metoxy-1,4-benzoquinol methylase
MQFKHRCLQRELLDDFALSGRELEKNLQNLSLANRFLGGNALVLKALKQVLHEWPHLTDQTFTIADLGCGGGDILRTIARWANKKSLRCELTGIDANPASIDFSKSQSKLFSQIHYQVLNIFSTEFIEKKFDIILLCTVCHHFTDEELIKLFSQLKHQARIAIIVSDLHRHWLSYSMTRWLTHICDCSYLEKHDGPLSVRKAFRYAELSNLLHQANLFHYRIQWCWPFRYQIIISTSKSSIT